MQGKFANRWRSVKQSKIDPMSGERGLATTFTFETLDFAQAVLFKISVLNTGRFNARGESDEIMKFE